MGVYELNQVELLKDVFVWSYECSCLLYAATRKSLGEPDLFRLKYRILITETLLKIVHGSMNHQEAVQAIKQQAIGSIPVAEQGHFINVVETELMGLHEGDIARYRIRPLEYQA